jgi:hypothetical protein
MGKIKNNYLIIILNLIFLNNIAIGEEPKSNSAILVSATESKEAESSRALHLSREIVNFGNIIEGFVPIATLIIANKGTYDVVIGRFVTDCGCLVTNLKNTTLKVGEKTEVKIMFFSEGFSGLQNRSIELYSSDQIRPFINIPIKATVQPLINVEPENIEFTEVTSGKAGNSYTKLKVVNIDANADYIIRPISKEVIVSPIKKYGKSIEVNISLIDDIAEGQFSSYILIKKKGKTNFKRLVPIYANIKPSLTIVPSSIKIDDSSTHNGVFTKILELQSQNNDELEIVRITTDSSTIETKEPKKTANGKFQVEVNLNINDVSKNQAFFRGAITFDFLNHPQKLVPISGLINRSNL